MNAIKRMMLFAVINFAMVVAVPWTFLRLVHSLSDDQLRILDQFMNEDLAMMQKEE